MEIILSETGERVCRLLGELFARSGETLYLVGGAVRDRLMGRGDENDFDFTTSAAPDKIQKIVRPSVSVCYDKSGAKGFGTMGLRFRDGVEAEITPYRLGGGFGAGGPAEGIEQDLIGRDFTINALAAGVTPADFGKVIDPSGGAADIAAGRLRTPAEPRKTFEDDPLRLLRAARFAAAFSLTVDPETLRTISVMAREKPCPLEHTAPERIRDELLRMMSLPAPSAAVMFLRLTGLLAFALPEVEALTAMRPIAGVAHKDAFQHTLIVTDAVRRLTADDPILVFSALLHDIGKPAARALDAGAYSFTDHEKTGARLAAELCKRLRLSNAQTARVCELILLHRRLQSYSHEWTDSAVRRALRDLGEDFDSALTLIRADITTSDPVKAERLRAGADDFRRRIRELDAQTVLNPRLPIDGNEIIRLLELGGGGPEVGAAVKYLKDLVTAGLLDPGDAETARAIVRAREWLYKC